MIACFVSILNYCKDFLCKTTQRFQLINYCDAIKKISNNNIINTARSLAYISNMLPTERCKSSESNCTKKKIGFKSKTLRFFHFAKLYISNGNNLNWSSLLFCKVRRNFPTHRRMNEKKKISSTIKFDVQSSSLSVIGLNLPTLNGDTCNITIKKKNELKIRFAKFNLANCIQSLIDCTRDSIHNRTALHSID